MIIPDPLNLWPGLWNLNTMAIAGLSKAGYDRWRESAEASAKAVGSPWPPDPGNCDTGHQIAPDVWVVYCPNIRYWLDRVGQYERYEVTARVFTHWIRPVQNHEAWDGSFLDAVAELLPPSQWERDRYIEAMDEDRARRMLATLLESGVEIRHADRVAVKIGKGDYNITRGTEIPGGWWDASRCIHNLTWRATLDELRDLVRKHWPARGEVGP